MPSPCTSACVRLADPLCCRPQSVYDQPDREHRHACASPIACFATHSPFTINPIGYTVILGYVAYIAWQINKPMSEGEKAALLVREQAAEEAAAAAGPFLQAAREAEGARELPSGLVFRELKAGEGEAPTPDNKVVVHYEVWHDGRTTVSEGACPLPFLLRSLTDDIVGCVCQGSLADGTVFDSSIKRGEPTEFKVDQVIKGWQEGLQLMRPGSKAVLTLPAELACESRPPTPAPLPSSPYDLSSPRVRDDRRTRVGGDHPCQLGSPV